MAGLAIDDPITLAQACASGRIIAGDTLTLAAGTYNASAKGVTGSNNLGQGVYSFSGLHGTSANPIIIKATTPGTVRINGGIEILDSEYVYVQDLEIAPTPTTRLTTRATGDFPHAVYINSANCRVTGCYIHDGIEGISLFGSPGSIISENIIINNGVSEPALHGCGIYTHNHAGGEIILEKTIWNTMGEHAINMWSAGVNNVQNYVCRKNVSLYGTIFAGIYEGTLQDILIEDNHIWYGSLRLGLDATELNDTVTMQRNRVHALYVAMTLYSQRAATIQENIISNELQVVASYIPSAYSMANTINSNTYYNPSNGGFYDYTPPNGVRTFAEWQSLLGYDADSTFNAAAPSVNEIFVYPFEYSARWVGMAVVWNWQSLDSVSVDLTDITSLNAGDSVIVSNSQDPNTDKATLLLDGDKKITIDMRAVSHSVVAPVEWTAADTTFPKFGAFMIEKA